MPYFGIPSRHFPAPGPRGWRNPRLGDPDEEQFRRGAAALKAALDLNPRGGYVKGSRAREALEKAIDMIPDSHAAALGSHLADGRGAIAELFRYRLARPTQATILELLLAKARRDRQRTQDQLDRKEAESARRVREICATVDELCSKAGEASDDCRNARNLVSQHGVRCQ